MYKILDRNELFEGYAVPEWATAAAHFKGHWYFEESLEQLNGSRFERVGSGCAGKYGHGAIKGFTKAVLFTPLIEQDDPLPPAPESVRYNDEYYHRSTYKQTWLDVKQDPSQIYIETGQYGEYKGVGIVLSPDAALQLAHDLTRMAMEIKRKEKQQGRKTTLSPAITHPYGE